MWCASIHEVAPNSAAAAAGKISRRRQPNFGWRAGARASQPHLVRASRKSGGSTAEGSSHIKFQQMSISGADYS